MTDDREADEIAWRAAVQGAPRPTDQHMYNAAVDPMAWKGFDVGVATMPFEIRHGWRLKIAVAYVRLVTWFRR